MKRNVLDASRWERGESMPIVVKSTLEGIGE